jgi:hypothetical protein
MNVTTDTFSKLLREGIERNARSVVFNHLLSGSLPDHLIDNFKRLLCYGSTPTDRWVSLVEAIHVHHLLHSGLRYDQWGNIVDMPKDSIIYIEIRNPNEKRLSLL